MEPIHCLRRGSVGSFQRDVRSRGGRLQQGLLRDRAQRVRTRYLNFLIICDDNFCCFLIHIIQIIIFEYEI